MPRPREQLEADTASLAEVGVMLTSIAVSALDMMGSFIDANATPDKRGGQSATLLVLNEAFGPSYLGKTSAELWNAFYARLPPSWTEGGDPARHVASEITHSGASSLLRKLLRDGLILEPVICEDPLDADKLVFQYDLFIVELTAFCGYSRFFSARLSNQTDTNQLIACIGPRPHAFYFVGWD